MHSNNKLHYLAIHHVQAGNEGSDNAGKNVLLFRLVKISTDR